LFLAWGFEKVAGYKSGCLRKFNFEKEALKSKLG